MSKVKLPDKYIKVEVRNKNTGKHFFGILNPESESNTLFVFAEDYVYQYTKDETKDLFRIFNQGDGIELDLDKY